MRPDRLCTASTGRGALVAFQNAAVRREPRLSSRTTPTDRASVKVLATEKCALSDLAGKALGAAAASLFFVCHPSLAEVQTVSPQDVTGLARSLPKQKVNKGKVWLIFLAGAGALFGAAIAVERNSKLFPAIAKANQAMTASRSASQEREQDQGTIEVEGQPDAEGQEAVLQGLADARSKVQEASPSEEPSRDGTQDHGVGNGAARSYPGIREEHQAKPDVPHNAQNWSAEQEREQIVDQSPPGS